MGAIKADTRSLDFGSHALASCGLGGNMGVGHIGLNFFVPAGQRLVLTSPKL